jgi:hypothetical protein
VKKNGRNGNNAPTVMEMPVIVRFSFLLIPGNVRPEANRVHS